MLYSPKLAGDCCLLNHLLPRQNCCHFADDIFKCIFLNDNVWISLTISLKFVPKFRINHIPALAHIMASELMMVSLRPNICVTRPQWVNMSHMLQVYCHAFNNNTEHSRWFLIKAWALVDETPLCSEVYIILISSRYIKYANPLSNNLYLL